MAFFPSIPHSSQDKVHRRCRPFTGHLRRRNWALCRQEGAYKTLTSRKSTWTLGPFLHVRTKQSLWYLVRIYSDPPDLRSRIEPQRGLNSDSANLNYAWSAFSQRARKRRRIFLQDKTSRHGEFDESKNRPRIPLIKTGLRLCSVMYF